MDNSASSIQVEEKSYGEEEEKGSLTMVVKLNSVEGGETEALKAVANEEENVEKPMVEVGHKRKASTDIQLSTPSPEIHTISSDSEDISYSPPMSPPTSEQPLNDQMVPQEEGGQEVNEQVDENKGKPLGRCLESDLNEAACKLEFEGEENFPIDVEQETEIEADAMEETEVEPDAAEDNNEKASDDTEKNEVKASAEEKSIAEHCAVGKIMLDPYPAQNNEVDPSAVDKIEVESLSTSEDDEEDPSLSVKKKSGFRSAKVFEFDLNELPPEEED